jgi:hypothetical protein
LLSHILSSTEASTLPSQHAAIRDLLQQFLLVFSEPQGLPPPRTQDHQIQLKTSQPVSVRPYCYLYFQKAEIEKIIKDLLLSGVIRSS